MGVDISKMPIATSQYWNNIYGWFPGEGKENIGLTDTENRVWTNFTR